MLYTGVLYGIDDNVACGAGQWISRKIPHEENYYYMRAKTFTDAVFTAAYTAGAAGSAVEAARALDTAGLFGSMALATAPTGGGGVAFGSVAVAELAESAVMYGVSFVSARMADRSQGIFRADMQKLEIIPRFKFLSGIKASNIVEKSAEEVNDWWRTAMGYTDPPYTPGSTVLEFELEEATTFVRVYDDVNSKMRGQWFMKSEDIAGLTPRQIQEKFALPTEPKYIVDLQLPAGSTIRTGEANSLFGFTGKGVQFDMMGQYIGEWVNPIVLP